MAHKVFAAGLEEARTKEILGDWTNKEEAFQFACIMPTQKEKGWGALRIEFTASNVGQLIKFKQLMRINVEASDSFSQKIRTTKPHTSSKLYQVDTIAADQLLFSTDSPLFN